MIFIRYKSISGDILEINFKEPIEKLRDNSVDCLNDYVSDCLDDLNIKYKWFRIINKT